MKRALLVCLALICTLSPAWGASNRSSTPLKIKSDELHADNDKKTATFLGNVQARQGDLTLYADRLVISYGAKGKDLSRIEAFGNVRILQGNRQAFAAHAVYENQSGRIVLDGAPRVLEGKNEISGNVITYFVDEKRSIVTGKPNEPVRAIIFPEGKNGTKP